MLAVLSLNGWADLAQYVLAISAVVALVGAAAQLRISHHQARRERVYAYADALNQLDLLLATEKHRENWAKWSVDDFKQLTTHEEAEQLRLPNLVEEIAYLYNQKVLDRRVAAELLGVYVEKLWVASKDLVEELRVSENRPRLYVDWEAMQNDTWRRRGAPGPCGIPPQG